MFRAVLRVLGFQFGLCNYVQYEVLLSSGGFFGVGGHLQRLRIQYRIWTFNGVDPMASKYSLYTIRAVTGRRTIQSVQYLLL